MVRETLRSCVCKLLIKGVFTAATVLSSPSFFYVVFFKPEMMRTAKIRKPPFVVGPLPRYT